MPSDPLPSSPLPPISARRFGKKQCIWWCAACGGQYNWRDPNRVLVAHDSADFSEAKVFGAHAVPPGACENRVCAVKFLANQQTGGDNLVESIFEVLQEQSRLKITNVPRSFIAVGNHVAVMMGEFNKDNFPDETIREGWES